jgi:L-aminopeptidase/D-esterase-like protein
VIAARQNDMDVRTLLLEQQRLCGHAAGAADPVIAGFFSQNGNGEMTGVSWITESGTFAGPVAITNTHAVGVAHAAIIAWAVRHHPRMADAWLLPVAAETWDGYLNDINGQHVTQPAALAALESAAAGPVEEGSVGGGTGMNCYSFKGGSGTASRVVPYRGTDYTVGVFLQANFGRRGQRPGRQRGHDRPARPGQRGPAAGPGRGDLPVRALGAGITLDYAGLWMEVSGNPIAEAT